MTTDVKMSEYMIQRSEELGREGHILERVMYMGSGQPPLIEDMFDDDVRGIVS